MKVHLQRFITRGGACINEDVRGPPDEAIASFASRCADDWSTTLELRRNDTNQLLVSVSNGEVAVLRRDGEEFYDLGGDSGAMGWAEFAHGGQLSEHPARHVVGLSEALRASMEYLDGTSAVAESAFAWERQGSVDA